MTDRPFTLFLASTPGLGGRSLTRILARNALLDRSQADFLGLSEAAIKEEYALPAKVAQAILSDSAAMYRKAEELSEHLSRLGVSLVTAADSRYPTKLEAFDPDPPGVLFLYGNTRLLEAPTFTVMSSRKAPSAALNQLEALVEAAVLAGEVLVSGHDTPEYQRAAVVPLRWGAPRILCFDRGLFRALGPELKEEPFRTARLWRYQFDPNTDLAISCFLPYANFIGQNNRVRDRMIAGLSNRLDFVHLSAGGTMDKMARLALKAGRRVRISDRCLGYRDFSQLGAEILGALPTV